MNAQDFELSDRDCLAADLAAKPARAPLDALLAQLRAERPDLAERLAEAVTSYAVALADAHTRATWAALTGN